MPDENDNTIIDLQARKTYWILNEKTSINIPKINPDDTTKLIHQIGDKHHVTYSVRTKSGSDYVDTPGAIDTFRFEFRFPEEFINSVKPRSIEVHHCRVSIRDDLTTSSWKQTNDLLLHADFIKRDTYLDHACMICNETRTKYKKYAYTSSEQTFGIWFTALGHPDLSFDYDNIAFTLELMLIY